MKLYGRINKFDALDDGTLEVSGVASSETVDDQGDIVLASAMKSAIPGYMALGGSGPLREMHQPLAAGKVVNAEVRPDGSTWIVARVVDPVAIEKVRQGVYKGFSIGGKILKRDGKKITGLQLNEISLVDKPACPDAVFKLGGGAATLARPNDVVTIADTLGLDQREAALTAELRRVRDLRQRLGDRPAPVMVKGSYATLAEREATEAAALALFKRAHSQPLKLVGRR